MRYYLSYKGKIFGTTMTKEETISILAHLRGAIGDIEIVEFEDNVQPILRRNPYILKTKRKTKNRNME
jgi:hypothetical protein